MMVAARILMYFFTERKRVVVMSLVRDLEVGFGEGSLRRGALSLRHLVFPFERLLLPGNRFS